MLQLSLLLSRAYIENTPTKKIKTVISANDCTSYNTPLCSIANDGSYLDKESIMADRYSTATTHTHSKNKVSQEII